MQFIKRWSLAVFIFTFLVIIAGGVVRTTQSGMGCPDWPKCFGKWIPPTHVSELPPDYEKYLRKQDIDHTFNVYHTWIEYFNRLLGALLGLFAVIQFAMLLLKRNDAKKSFRLSAAFLALVILTGLFGALVVKYNLAHASISVHLLFALVMIQVQLALILSLNNKLHSIELTSKQKKWLYVFLVVLIIQLVLGTLVRMHVDDVSKTLQYQQREKWLADYPIAFLLHRSFSWLVLVATFFITYLFYKEHNLKNKVFILIAFILLNMLAGLVLVYANMPAAAQPVHLLLATFAVTQLCYLIFITKQRNAA